MTETILQYLMWAVPSGGIGAAIAWIANRGTRRTREAKEVHDTYKAMYHDVSAEIKELRKDYEELSRKFDNASAENRAIKRSLDRLSRAIEAIRYCPYNDSCPVRTELQAGEKPVTDGQQQHEAGAGQHRKGGIQKKAGLGARVRDKPESAGGQPAQAPSGSGVHREKRTGEPDPEL